MEFRSVSWSGTCQLLWMMMRSRSPAKEWALFIVWASERERGRERKTPWEHFNTAYENKILCGHSGCLKGGGTKILTCAPFCHVWERDCKVWWLVPFFSLGFWSYFMVSPLICSVLYSGAEERSPRWLPRHRNLSISSVILNPLVSFRLSPLNVFDFV